ncbi:MAG: hypothetical protein AB7O74_16960 [Candidatus Nanopelagicales bacterium]
MIRTTGRASALAAAAALLVGGAAVAAQPAGAAAPTATSTSLPTLAPVSLTSAKLPRKPPTLTNATVIKVKDQMGEIKLNPSRDYRILLPTTRAWKNNRGLWITGGHNVVVIGGTVDVGYGWRDGSGKVVKRAAYFRDSTGTVHIEGVRFMSSSTQKLTEGIDVSLPGASLRLFNVWMSSLLTGSQSTNHADVIQAWGGPKYLFVDGLTAATQYQGLFLTPQQHSSASVSTYDLRRIWIDGRKGAYLLWRTGSFPIRTSEVHVTGSTRQSSGLWPNRSAWPYVKTTKPSRKYGSNGGVGYRSPGYLA